jgi:hypothetical protein
LLLRSRPPFSAPRPKVICPHIILSGVHWPLGVVSSILDTVDCLRLICLLSVGEFFDAFGGSVSDLREPLRIR